eukprot:COSAG01_NODE_9473_length_2436_cov_900.703894_1_plen_80_part_00
MVTVRIGVLLHASHRSRGVLLLLARLCRLGNQLQRCAQLEMMHTWYAAVGLKIPARGPLPAMTECDHPPVPLCAPQLRS